MEKCWMLSAVSRRHSLIVDKVILGALVGVVAHQNYNMNS